MLSIRLGWRCRAHEKGQFILDSNTSLKVGAHNQNTSLKVGAHDQRQPCFCLIRLRLQILYNVSLNNTNLPLRGLVTWVLPGLQMPAFWLCLCMECLGKADKEKVSFLPLVRPQSYQIRAHPMTLFNLNCLLMTLSPESLGGCPVGTLSRQSNTESLSWTLNSILLDDTLLSFCYRSQES